MIPDMLVQQQILLFPLLMPHRLIWRVWQGLQPIKIGHVDTLQAPDVVFLADLLFLQLKQGSVTLLFQEEDGTPGLEIFHEGLSFASGVTQRQLMSIFARKVVVSPYHPRNFPR